MLLHLSARQTDNKKEEKGEAPQQVMPWELCEEIIELQPDTSLAVAVGLVCHQWRAKAVELLSLRLDRVVKAVGLAKHVGELVWSGTPPKQDDDDEGTRYSLKVKKVQWVQVAPRKEKHWEDYLALCMDQLTAKQL